MIAAVLVVVAAILRRALLAVDLARVQAEVPDFRVVLDLETLVRREPRAVQPQGLCKLIREHAPMITSVRNSAPLLSARVRMDSTNSMNSRFPFSPAIVKRQRGNS